MFVVALVPIKMCGTKKKLMSLKTKIIRSLPFPQKQRKIRERGRGHKMMVVVVGVAFGPNTFCIRAVLGQGKVKQGFSFYCGVSFVRLREPG